MTQRTETRFLVITHNPITMARMDRLFGVTMAERGVSQLVSVDLTGRRSACGQATPPLPLPPLLPYPLPLHIIFPPLPPPS